MEYENFNLANYLAVYEQQTGHTMPTAGKTFLKYYFQQTAIFRGWGYWDCRSGLQPLSREQINDRCVRHLTGNPDLGAPHLAAFAEAFANAMADFYQEGRELAEALSNNERTMRNPPPRTGDKQSTNSRQI